ncbi:MAG: hypothetical protein HDQ96_02665 [Lachnospiraceae bacterium]|nr:hypothetical protein [Lachnospiraceae bacterium]
MKLYDTTQEQPEQIPDTAPQIPEPKTFFYRFKNWWYYHKWHVICGIILAWILIDVVGGALGLWAKKPDFQIAYVGSAILPDDTVSSLEQAFAELAGDFNQDGEVIVQVNQYIISSDTSDYETASYSYSSEVLLMGDISSCDSYFFLTDDPGYLQRGFQILADPDGSCPDETDDSVDDKVVCWTDCSVLAGMDLGSYTAVISGSEVTGDNQELLSGLYLGRRYFYSDKTVDSLSQCDTLWNTIISTNPHAE